MARVDGFGALSNDLEVYEIRNASAATCDMYGYFGVSGIDMNGRVYGVADRSTDSYFGTFSPPHRVVLLAGTPAIRPVTTDGSRRPPVYGHAFVDIGYGAACGGGVQVAADRWRFIPPDEYGSIKLIDPGAGYSNCGLNVHPVEEEPYPAQG